MSCLTLDDIVLSDEQGLLHGSLMEFYQDYIARQARQGERPLPPREWLLDLSSKHPEEGASLRVGDATALRILEGLLGENISQLRTARRGATLSFIDDTPRPESLDSARATRLVTHVQGNPVKLWERLDNLLDRSGGPLALLATSRRVSIGYINILKGNLVEVLSLPYQHRTLYDLKYVLRRGELGQDYSNAELFTGVMVKRLRNGRPTGRQLFSDNIIAVRRPDGSLDILLVFEVKSGFRGGKEAQEQIFEWVEGGIEDGLQLIIPEGAKAYDIAKGAGEGRLVTKLQKTTEIYTYDPGGQFGGDKVINLIAAPRRAIVPRGASQIGIDPSLSPAARVDMVELNISSSEADYLCRELLKEPQRLPQPQRTVRRRRRRRSRRRR